MIPYESMHLLQRFSHKLEQCFRWGIVRLTETLVEFRVIGLTGSEALGRNTGAFQDSLKALCLCGGVWMLGNVEDEKRGNAFVLGDVIDRGVVAVFRRIIAEFFAVTPFCLLQTMHATAGFSSGGRSDASRPTARWS